MLGCPFTCVLSLCSTLFCCAHGRLACFWRIIDPYPYPCIYIYVWMYPHIYIHVSLCNILPMCYIYICRALCIQSSAPSRRHQLKPQKQIGCKTMESAWHCIYILCILRGYRAVRIAQTAHTVHTVSYNTHNTYITYCIYCTYRTYPAVLTFWRSLIRNVLNIDFQTLWRRMEALFILSLLVAIALFICYGIYIYCLFIRYWLLLLHICKGHDGYTNEFGI